MNDKDASVRTDVSLNSSHQPKATLRLRQRNGLAGLALGASALVLAGCGDPVRDNLAVGTIGAATGFAGMVAIDEPRAALVARDALSAGGTAVDAAVAAAWTLAVTLPSGVGVAGGGLCVVHDARSKTTEVLDFLPPPSGGIGAGGMAGGVVVDNRNAWPVAAPALPRGLFALHAKYGRLRWEAVMAPAESVARFGNTTSRALARDLASAGTGLTADPAARAVFTVGGTRLLNEGDRLTQVDLAATLARLRQHGPGTLYDGMLGNQFLDAVAQAGGRLSREDLRAYRPTWRPTESVRVGNETLHVPPTGIAGHEMLTVWRAGVGAGSGFATGAGAEGATGMLVVDGDGSAVACGLTMNGAFGLGRMAPGTGVLMAQPGPAEGQTRVPLAGGLLINHHVNKFRFGVAAGGAGAPTNAGQAARAIVADRQTVEQGLSSLPGPARTNAATCLTSVPDQPDTCRVAVDPRGAGFSALIGAGGRR